MLVIESKTNWTGGHLRKALSEKDVPHVTLAEAHLQAARLPHRHIMCCSFFNLRGCSQRFYNPFKEITVKGQTYCFVPVVFAHFHPKLLAFGSGPQPGGKLKRLPVAQPGHPGSCEGH